jgi:hypothetical protein
VNAIVRFLFPKIEQKQNMGSENEWGPTECSFQFWIREDGSSHVSWMRELGAFYGDLEKATVYGC